MSYRTAMPVVFSPESHVGALTQPIMKLYDESPGGNVWHQHWIACLIKGLIPKPTLPAEMIRIPDLGKPAVGLESGVPCDRHITATSDGREVGWSASLQNSIVDGTAGALPHPDHPYVSPFRRLVPSQPIVQDLSECLEEYEKYLASVHPAGFQPYHSQPQPVAGKLESEQSHEDWSI